MGLVLYNVLLGAVLLVSAPVWGWRMLRDGRYREGLGQRLGGVPERLRLFTRDRRVLWVHAVSVGEVLAAERLVRELESALGQAWRIVVSTTTATGQRIAQQRFGADRVFFWPLDFSWIVGRYLRELQPEMLVLVESELWPGMLHACRRRGVPVVVVNARMSDRSFRRAQRFAGLWRWLAAGVTAFFAQGGETAGRLRGLGAVDVRPLGNLKYDLPAHTNNAMTDQLRDLVRGRKVVVAGSTLQQEEPLLLHAWNRVLQVEATAVLILAPRHPERFAEVSALLADQQFHLVRASACRGKCSLQDATVVLLDTLGDLASVYQLAEVAFVGGSLTPKGGHNPLEAARFGVPVVMGPSYENFREIVDGLRKVGALRVVNAEELAGTWTELLRDGADPGEAGRQFFLSQAGATERTVRAVQEMLRA